MDIFVSGFLFGVRPTSKSHKSSFYKVLFSTRIVGIKFKDFE